MEFLLQITLTPYLPLKKPWNCRSSILALFVQKWVLGDPCKTLGATKYEYWWPFLHPYFFKMSTQNPNGTITWAIKTAKCIQIKINIRLFNRFKRKMTILVMNDPKNTLRAPKNEYWWPFFDPYFFQNEYWKPLTGPNFEYWPLETIPLDIIMRVFHWYFSKLNVPKVWKNNT